MNGLDILNNVLPDVPRWVFDGRNSEKSHVAKTTNNVIPEGQRNGALFKLACSLRAKNVSSDTASMTLESENKLRCNPPLSELEVKKIIDSAYRYEPSTNIFNATDLELEEKPKGGEKNRGVVKNLRVVGIHDFLSTKLPSRENILSPWLYTQGLGMVHGPRGLGKTFVVIGISVAVTSGGDFLKWKSNKPYGVLHLDGEMPAVTLQERYCQFIVSNDLEITAPLKIITPDLQEFGMPDLSCNTGREALEPHLEGISLVIVDNISTLCKGGRENEAESWLPVQEWALKLRTRGISVLFVHHAGKAGLQRGTSRREDVLDTVISLKRPADYRPDEGARFEVHFEKSRGIYGDDVKPFEAILITGIDGKQQWVVKDLEESTTEKVVKLLNEGMTQNEIAEELKISKGTVSKHKQKAKNRKLL